MEINKMDLMNDISTLVNVYSKDGYTETLSEYRKVHRCIRGEIIKTYSLPKGMFTKLYREVREKNYNG